LWLALCSVAFFAGCAKNQAQPAGQTGTGTGRPPAVVSVQPVKKDTVTKELAAGGQITGVQTVTVGPRVSGKVGAVHVKMGQAVNAGEVLFELDKTDVENGLRQARAALAVAQENVKLADVNRANAKIQMERYRKLFEAEAVSADTFEQYVLKHEQAAARVPEAQLAQAEAAVAVQESQMAHHTVRAPIRGTVAKVNVNPGEIVSAASQCITLVDLSRVKVPLTVGEAEVNRIAVGQDCRVMVSAARQEPFTGRVSAVSPAADERTKGFAVEITLDNPGGALKQGMYAEVYLVTEKAEDILTVPVEAVLERGARRVVFVVAGGEAEERAVVTGVSDGRRTEIKEGLTEGEMVAVAGHQTLTNGAKVSVAGGPGAGPPGGAPGGGPGGGTGGGPPQGSGPPPGAGGTPGGSPAAGGAPGAARGPGKGAAPEGGSGPAPAGTGSQGAPGGMRP